MSLQRPDYSKEIEAKLQDLEAPIAAVLINPIFYQGGIAQVTSYFTNRMGHGIYVSLNRPVASIKVALLRQDVLVDRLRFIDCVTNTTEREESDCFFLGKMQELTTICLALSKSVQSWKDSRYAIVDSLSTLLIYNDAKSVARFAHLATEKLRGWSLGGAMVVADMVEEKDLLAHLAQFSDAVLSLGA